MTTDTSIATCCAARHVAAVGRGAITLHPDDDRLCWTQVGIRMGFTRDEFQRVSILNEITQMPWIETGMRPRCLAGPAARAIVRAILGHHPDQLCRVGIARLGAGRRLIGLEDALGNRSYVLDLNAEAVHLLNEFNHHQPRSA